VLYFVVTIFSLRVTGSWWLVTQGFLLRTGDCIRLGLVSGFSRVSSSPELSSLTADNMPHIVAGLVNFAALTFGTNLGSARALLLQNQ